MSVKDFAIGHAAQINATLGLVSYAIARNKLTPGGVVAGVVIATIHMMHPWPAFFWLLIAFFLCGTAVTKIGHKAKLHLTQSSTGSPGGEGPRSTAQVLANSAFATALIALHGALISSTPFTSSTLPLAPGPDFPTLTALLPIGIVAQYAAVAADTFSSELGILAKGTPVLITAPWRRVPAGTNGGVTAEGLLYGALGSALLTATAVGTLFFLPPGASAQPATVVLVVGAGAFGSVLDSFLGAVAQVTVTDRGSGKVVEGAGGARVQVVEGGTRVRVGMDLLTNNGVNFVMAAGASLAAMGVAWVGGLQWGRQPGPVFESF